MTVNIYCVCMFLLILLEFVEMFVISSKKKVKTVMSS